MRTRRGTAAVIAVVAGAIGLVAGTTLASNNDLTANGGAARLGGDQTSAIRHEIKGGTARNVILLIGDGMGDSEITAARNYQYGAAGAFPGIDSLPLTGQYTTYALDRTDGLPDYVTDSAASGSGWATGTKTYNGAISVDIAGTPQRTLLEIAKANGLRTGDVSTAELQDATPAVQVAHVTDRGCYAPSSTTRSCPSNALENGGDGSITEQLIETRPDVTLGGGATSFAEAATAGPWAGKTLLQQAQERGYQVVTDAAGLAAVGSADQRTPLLGLFSPGNMPTRWTGPLATHTGGAEPAVRCSNNPAHVDTLPTLAEMTSTAISLLDQPGARRGFFLQVEGASIDKRDHAADPCGQIGETVDLDEAVQVAMDFARAQGNTLVVVTADHGHSSQIVYPGITTPGLTRTLLTADGKPMTMAYGTAEVGGSQAHTGTQLRIAGYGPRAANVIGLTDQTDLFFTILEGLRLDPSLPSPGPLVIERVNVDDGATLRGDTTVKVRLDTEARYTYIELNQGGQWVTDNTKEPGSNQAGRQPTLRLDTRKFPNGDYTLKIDAVADDGRTTELLIDITIRNR